MEDLLTIRSWRQKRCGGERQLHDHFSLQQNTFCLNKRHDEKVLFRVVKPEAAVVSSKQTASRTLLHLLLSVLLSLTRGPRLPEHQGNRFHR